MAKLSLYDDQATEGKIELAATEDLSEDFLSEEELSYYLNLKDI